MYHVDQFRELLAVWVLLSHSVPADSLVDSTVWKRSHEFSIASYVSAQLAEAATAWSIMLPCV